MVVVVKKQTQQQLTDQEKRRRQLTDSGLGPKGAQRQLNQEARQALPQQQAQNAIEQAQQQAAVNKEIINQTGGSIPQQQANQNIPNPEASVPPQFQDTRGFISKTFFPTAEEGKARGLKTFGTESAAAPIAAAGVILATGGLASFAAGTGIFASEAAPIAIEASEKIATAGLFSSKLVKAAALFWVAGKATEFSAADLKDADTGLTRYLDGADAAIRGVKAGDVSPEEALFAIENVQTGIDDLDSAFKIGHILQPHLWFSGGNKFRAKLANARRAVDFMRANLMRIQATASTPEAQAQTRLQSISSGASG